jgi:amidophosphoribosyltransferase
MPSAEELIAHGRTEEEVGVAIGADRMFYQDLDDLIASVQKGNKKIASFDCSVFTGDYVTEVSDDYFEQLKDIRGDKKKSKRAKESVAIDLHNNT